MTTYPSCSFAAFESDPLWHKINLEYPGLRLIRERPYIFVIPHFLSEAETSGLVAKVSASIGGSAGRSDAAARCGDALARTSRCVVCKNDEVAGVRQKLRALTRSRDAKLQPTKLSRYCGGDRFDLHTDAWRGDAEPTVDDFFDSAGVARNGSWPALYAPAHNTVATVFVYLNDVARGGRTVFPSIGIHRGPGSDSFYNSPGPFVTRTYPDGESNDSGCGLEFWRDPTWQNFCEPPLEIKPERGLAVIHFPAVLPEHGGAADANVFHRSEPAVDEKFIMQQFVASSDTWRLDSTSTPFTRLSETNL